MGDEGNREAIAQMLQSVEKARQMVGGLSLVAFLLDQIEDIPENRTEYIELLRQMFKLAGYIRRMRFLKGFVNHEGLGTHPVAFSPWKPTYLDHAECWVVFCRVRQQFREIFLEMGFEEMPTNNFVESRSSNARRQL
ncbi:hypothetical protein SUGI_1104770 [Cryptomeria japonica]|nr:hypothetical protein SUGI_1104770 [Cryptomeria japonica]